MASQLKVLITREEIEAAVRRLASQVNRDYQGRELLIVGVLKGSFIFLADLIRLIESPLEVEFIGVSSYRGTETTGEIRVVQELTISATGKDILLVEDIVDTGLTTSFVLAYLGEKGPASLKLCTLLDKPARREVAVAIDYLGFTVPDRFVVGYGLDYNQKFRNLPQIYTMEEL